MTRITKDPATRRQEIIDAARELFEAQGTGKTSMTEISARVGVAKGLVYYYFSSKEQLAEEVVNQFIEGLDQELQEITRQDNLDFYSKLKAILSLYFKSFQNHTNYLKFSPADPGIFNLLRERASEIALIHANEILHQGMAQNLISIEYPEYMLKILVRGLGELYIEGISELRIHTTLIEQTLGLAKGRLQLG